jgi:hypothetical protein
MRNLVLASLVVIFLAGCASGSLVGTLPVVPDPSTAARVIIARPSSFFGAARTPTITIDGVDIYDIGPGEHVAILIAPGEHIIGTKIWDMVTHRGSVQIQAAPGRTYYFVTSPGTMIAQVAEAEGRELVAQTTAIGDNAWKGQRWEDRTPAPR